MSNSKIRLKKSSVIGKIPTTSDLDYGELAINYADGIIYYKNSSNEINSFIDSDLVNSAIESKFGLLESDLTSGLANKLNIIDFDSSFNVNFSEKTTDDLSEGFNNLYYTSVRADSAARHAISATNGLDFDVPTGVLTILPTGVSVGTYGSSTQIPIITVNDRGQLDSIGFALVDGIDSVSYDSGTAILSITTADGFDFGATINLSPFTTSDLSEGTNLYYTTARFDSDFGVKSTTDLSEGSNLYFTTERVRSSLSASGDLSYDSVTGVFSYTGTGAGTGDYNTADFDSDFAVAIDSATTDDLTEGTTNLYYTSVRADSDARNAISVTDSGGDGSLSYDPETGKITYLGPSPSEVRSHFSVSPNLRYDSNTGIFSLDSSIIIGGDFTSSTLTGKYLGFDSDFSSKSTSDLTEGTNLYYTTTRSDSDFDVRLTTKTTDDLTEGTNLYFTTLRAHDAIATYDSNINTTGSIVAATFEGDGSALTGVKADNVVEEVKNVSGGTLLKGTPVYPTGAVGNAVTVIAADASDSDKMPAIGVLAQDLADDAEGLMIISGKIVGVNTGGYNAGDIAYVGIGGGWTDTPPTGEGNIVQSLGYFTRIDSSNGGGVVELGDERTAPNLANGNILLGTDGGAPSPTTLNTTIVPEGTNLYYTTTRFDSDFGTKSTTDLTEGTNLYYTTVRADSDFDVRLATKTTDDLTEGANLYYTTTRSDSDFDARIITKTTSDLSEGTNLYYTTTRFDSDFGTKSTTDLTEGANLYYTKNRVDSDFDDRFVTKTTTDLSEGTNLYYTTARADSDARSALNIVDTGGDGSLSYDSATGTLTYTGPSASEVRAHLSPGGGIDFSGGVISHTDTSTQSSVDNSNGNVIQGVSLDSYGHVTSLGSVDLDTRYVNLSGDTMTGFLTLHADPTNAFHAVTKEYADNLAQGVRTAPSTRAATTSNLVATYDNGTLGVGATLTSTSNGLLPDIDSVSNWQLFDGILVKEQDSAAHNGRYFISTLGDSTEPWVLTKCTFCDEADEIPGSYVFVQEGALYEGTGWIQIVEDPATFTVGTDGVFVTQFSGAGTYVGGDGIDITGNVFSIDSAQLTTIIQNIDGAGSGIDADLLDGQQGSYYRINVYDASGVLQN